MKKLSLFLILLTLPLSAYEDWDDDVFQVENAPPPFYPISISGEYISICETDFRTRGFEDNDLKYRQWNTAFAYTHPFCEISGLIFGAGYIGTEVDFKGNPEFNETRFNYVNLSIGGFTKSFPCWTWTLTLGAFIDTEEFSLSDYALYQGVLWGRYDLCQWIELDFGLIVEVGLKKEKVWPILGFRYLPCEGIRINAIYPINIMFEYDIQKCLTLAGSIRFFRDRHRVQENEQNSQGIFEYHTTGAEADLIYAPFDWFSVKGFVGRAFDGDLRIANRNNKRATHYKFNGAFYAGISGILSF